MKAAVSSFLNICWSLIPPVANVNGIVMFVRLAEFYGLPSRLESPLRRSAEKPDGNCLNAS